MLFIPSLSMRCCSDGCVHHPVENSRHKLKIIQIHLKSALRHKIAINPLRLYLDTRYRLKIIQVNQKSIQPKQKSFANKRYTACNVRYLVGHQVRRSGLFLDESESKFLI